MVWFKAVVRGEYISAIKMACKDHNSEIVELQEKEHEFAEEHTESPSDAPCTSLLEAWRLLSIHYTDLAHTEAGQKSLFAQGDKNGKLLAMLMSKTSFKHPRYPAGRDNGIIYTLLFLTLCTHPAL